MTAAGADDSDSVFFLLEVVPVVFIVLGQGEEKLPRFTPIFCELLFDVIEDLFDVVEDLFVSTTAEAEEEEEEEEEVEATEPKACGAIELRAPLLCLDVARLLMGRFKRRKEGGLLPRSLRADEFAGTAACTIVSEFGIFTQLALFLNCIILSLLPPWLEITGAVWPVARGWE